MLKKISLFVVLIWSFCVIPSLDALDLGSNDDEIIYCSDSSECGLDTGIDVVGDALDGAEIEKDQSTVEFVQNVVQYILTFVAVIALIYIIYAGFRILVSGGSEDVQKAQRKNIFAVVIGILIIWLAYPFIKWIIEVALQK